MKRSLFLLLVLSPLLCYADADTAETCVRQGRYADALDALASTDESPDACYWRGRALAGLQRMTEAALAFSKVPQEHELFPYAAKGIMYCAWKSNYINFVEAVAPLTISTNAEIASLATAAMAEFQLRHTKGGDTASLQELRRIAQRHEELLPTLRLLEVEDLRKQGKFDEAIARCREIESDGSLSPATHHRARLALAEVHYDKEESTSGTPLDSANDEVDEDGMGEEILLQFISSNPESPLLEEAFRRLVLHRAFTTSKYAIRRLQEWRDDLSQPHRAALALLMQQRAAFAGQDDVPGSSLANAASALTRERAARIVIHEQVRTLLAQGDTKQASLFLSMLPDATDSRSLFYRASCTPPEDPSALDLYLQSIRNAPGEMMPPAVADALFCAYKGGNTQAVQELLNQDFPRHVRWSLLLTYAALLREDNPPLALQVINELLELSPNGRQEAEARLIRAGITMATDPTDTLASLLEIPENAMEVWTDDQVLRLYYLQMEAVDRLTGDSHEHGIDRARKILASCKRPEVATKFTFNLVRRLSRAGLHAEALKHLEDIANNANKAEVKAKALLLAAEESAKIGSQASLSKSIDLFEQCSRIPSPYADRADVHRAEVLMWTNKIPQAIVLLNDILKREGGLTANDLALVCTALADAYGMEGTDEGLETALGYSARLQQIPGLSQEWRVRGRLQHAALSARSGRTAEAMADYEYILGFNPDTQESLTEAQWFALTYAGSGAIYQYMENKDADKAADLADKLSRWLSGNTGKIGGQDASDYARRFDDWAKEIRRNNF